MVYLNEGMEGGGTHFTEIDLRITPKLGMALFWNNLMPDGSPNPATMHCGEPVISGFKIIITKWFRVFGHGPVLYATESRVAASILARAGPWPEQSNASYS